MPRHDASGPLLDAAERLFAEQGIHVVSDRRIAEAAGNSNHSAVRYYFGGREGLIRALLDRHREQTNPLRSELFANAHSLLDDIRALVMPTTAALAELPSPSWRARFLAQAQHDPSTMAIMAEESDDPFPAREVYASIVHRLDHLDPEIVRGRAELMNHLVATTCAALESRSARSGETPEWQETGDFLCDAIAGMLQAPTNRPLLRRRSPS